MDFDPGDTEYRAARAAGWGRGDLLWERLQERGNACFDAGDAAGARQAWRRAYWLGLALFSGADPRRATGLANL
ncbi:MAG: tetratricopeptide repeat-containing protein, partial [Roseovarius sp.]|nr:tetratricopeptide repeat-containing protein [Roseovarius sp.]